MTSQGLPCIRLERGKFESTNQDSAGGKNSSVLARVVQKMDKAIHRINHYPLDSE